MHGYLNVKLSILLIFIVVKEKSSKITERLSGNGLLYMYLRMNMKLKNTLLREKSRLKVVGKILA